MSRIINVFTCCRERPRALLAAVVLLAAAPSIGCGTRECHPGDEGVIGGARSALAPTDGLRVITFNLLHGFAGGADSATLEERLGLVVDELRDLAPDVVLLQEASVTPPEEHCNVAARIRDALSDGDTPWSSVQAPRNGSELIGFWEGPAVLSRYRLEDAATMEPEHQAPFEHRVAVRATVFGGPTVISTHLTNQDAAVGDRPLVEVQARAVAIGALAAAPAVLGGDFNAAPGSSAVGAVRELGGRDLAAGGAAGDDPTSLAGDVDDASATFESRIDYLFGFAADGDEGLGVVSCRRVLATFNDAAATYPSDHAGVLCDLPPGAFRPAG